MKKRLPPHGRLLAALFTLAVGTSMLFSCSREMEMIGADQEDDSIEIVINVGTPDTKTGNSGTATVWSDGDALSVFHSASGATAPSFWSSWFGFYSGNAFQGTVRKLSSTNDWYAVYPYREENVSPAAVSFTFPSRQTQVGNSNMEHFAGESFPLFGKTANVPRSEDLSISMGNLLVGVQFKIQNNTASPIVIQEVEFTAESYITGGFTVDMTGDSPVLSHGSSASKKVTLTVTDGDAIPAGQTALFNAAIAPYDVPAGGSFDIKVIGYHPDTPNSKIFFYITKTIESGTSFQAGHIKVVNVPFDESHSQNPDAGSAGEVELEVGEQPEDGVYLLVYKHGETSMAFAAFDEYKSQKYAIPVTVVDGVVLPQDGIDLSRFAITIEKAGIEHPNDAGHDAYNVKNSDGKFIFHASGGSGDAYLRIQDTNVLMNSSTNSEVTYYHTFVQTADGVQILSSGSQSGFNQYLLAYTEANGFYYEQNNNGQKLQLYLLGGSVKEHQELAFSAEKVTYNFDTNGEGPLTGAPTLSGNMTPVSWSSNNDSVATVDDRGNVTIHGVGNAIITATAEADEIYYSDSASYTIEVTSSSIQTWYKADKMEAGKQYLIVSNGYALQNNNGSIAATAVSVSNETILLNAPSGILWTANSSNQLTNNSQYLGSSSSSSGGGFPGYGTQNLSIGSQSSALAWTYEAESDLLTCSISSWMGGATTNYLYYSNSSNAFTINSNASDTHIAALYSTTKPIGKQTLSFAQPSVIWTIGEGYALNGSYAFPQTVSGNVTPVNYTSSNTNVATISGNRITILGTGSTIIKARTEGNDEYAPAEASYTLRIREQVSGDFVNLGTFNLENADVSAYLTAAATQYTNDISSTIVEQYAPGGSKSTISNKTADFPKPVTIDWGTRSNGNTTITVYEDAALQEEVWQWTASSGSTSYDVYNLIPEKTYYCTVEDATGSLLQGYFETTGRRRMIRVSGTNSENNARNCRDLGGLITADGKKRIKYGMIFRGTNMNSTTPEEKNLLVNFLNIGLDNDLREPASTKNVFQGSGYSVKWVAPGYQSNINELTDVSKAKQTMQAFIDIALGRYHEQQPSIPGEASYFHCYIGSDRTGYWGLAVEGLLGVSAKDCSIDYELTSFANKVSNALGTRPRNAGLFKSGMDFFTGKSYYKTPVTTDSYYTDNLLQYAITKYFIDEVGISEADIVAFKNAVLEDI